MADKLVKLLPNTAPDGPLGTEEKGILSPIGDPVGQVLDKGLKPVGVLTGSIGRPSGQALLNVEEQAKRDHGYSKENKPEADRDLPGGERIGGNAQTAKNPLGL